MYLNPRISKLRADLSKNTQNLIRRPAKPKKPRRHEESDIQQTIVTWSKLYKGKIGGETFFLSDYLHANPNGGKRDPREAARLKREGVKAGVSDLFVSIPSKGYHGLWVEVKTEKGVMTKAQKDFFALQQWMGYRCEVVRSILEFVALIEDYLD